jgi:hypothetical protein
MCRWTREDEQVVQAIVFGVPVDVVNDLSGQQGPPYSLFYN